MLDKILDVLYQPIAGGALLYMEFLLYLAAGVLVLLGVLSAVSVLRRNRLPKPDENYRRVKCASCNWEGMVSKYVRVCPRCNDSNFVQTF